MVALDMINTRLKDFYDLWAIANAFEFDGTVLARAIAATLERRQTKVPAQIPAALTAAYADEGRGQDRKSVVAGNSVSVRVDLGGGRRIKKKKNPQKTDETHTQ